MINYYYTSRSIKNILIALIFYTKAVSLDVEISREDNKFYSYEIYFAFLLLAHKDKV